MFTLIMPNNSVINDRSMLFNKSAIVIFDKIRRHYYPASTKLAASLVDAG
ncbi:hypothetical protein [Methylomonas albis]|uniref:Uncharacterized protein n=1 Tax=Methylomonas albis TaxID=1854563 RepID=A0ABR9D0K0_9GAMM|nr:hypothetical protein [Methylomonas albis]MBD9356623.1 hypothetical protein [Methylomonas albis]